MTREEITEKLKSLKADIVSCGGCEGKKDYAQALTETIEALQTEPQKVGRWVPCYDEQPERDDIYLVTWTAKIGRDSSVRFIYICEYYDGEWVTDEIAKMGYRDIEVVAWMELPEKWEG